MVEGSIAADRATFEASCQLGVLDLGGLWDAEDEDPLQYDVCFDGFLCLGVNDSTVTVEGGFGPLQGEVGFDLGTGDFSLGIGLGARDPTGMIRGTALVKFHTDKGVGVGVDVKVGPALAIKASRDVWLTD